MNFTAVDSYSFSNTLPSMSAPKNGDLSICHPASQGCPAKLTVSYRMWRVVLGKMELFAERQFAKKFSERKFQKVNTNIRIDCRGCPVPGTRSTATSRFGQCHEGGVLPPQVMEAGRSERTRRQIPETRCWPPRSPAR